MRRALVLCVLLVAIAACTGDDEVSTATTPTTEAAEPVTAEVDWTGRRISVDGDIPFDVNFCEGDAPMLCITDDGSMLGSIELLSYDDVIDDFAAWGNDFYASVEADRRTACPTYELHGDVPTTAPFAGAKGVRYGFTGTVGDTVVERVIGVVANDGAGAVHLLVANALAENDEQTCLHKEAELPVDAMDAIEPVLLALAAGSSF